MNDVIRTNAYGEGHALTAVDRFGIWLSSVQVRRSVKSFKELDVADIGCGFDARFARTIHDQVSSLHLFDVSLAPELKLLPKVRVHEGDLTATLQSFPPETLDVILCLSVLEHLGDPDAALSRFWHLLRKDGVCLINVPSWRGKRFLEFSAFRLGWSPANEMDDHKFYFDARDLWPRLVRAGFKPSRIKCFAHKFGLNVFASCRK